MRQLKYIKYTMKRPFLHSFTLSIFITCVVAITPQFLSAQKDSLKKTHLSGNPSHDSIPLGVSVSPSRVKFTVKPGGTQSQVIKVTNNTKNSFDFQTSFSDYVQNTIGQPMFTDRRQPKSKYALSNWATITPSLFTVAPGKTQKLTVTVSLPDVDSVNHAAWTVLSLDQVNKKTPVPIPGADEKTLQLGITPTFGFGVYLYQNPPSVKINNIEILNFSYRDTIIGKSDSIHRQLYMKITNTGDGISYCYAYMDITNLASGQDFRLGNQQFTILPGFTREFLYELPKDIVRGANYSAIGVIYFGEKTPKKVAQLNFSVR